MFAIWKPPNSHKRQMISSQKEWRDVCVLSENFLGTTFVGFTYLLQLTNSFCLQGIVRCLAISPDGRWVFSASDDKSVRIWDTQNAVMQCRLEHDCRVWTVDVSPVGCNLASGGIDNMVRIWRCAYVTP